MKKTFTLLLATALVVAFLPLSVDAATPCGRDCSDYYENCCQDIWDANGTITQQQMDQCASLTAACWYFCPGYEGVQRCVTTYSYYCGSTYETDVQFDTYASDSGSCGSMTMITKENSCW